MNKAEQLIACLEGEIAKRDEELAACRVAVENCELFRSRIAELENDASYYAARNEELRAELSAIKAQEPVAWAATARKKGVTDQRAFCPSEAATDEWISHYIGLSCDVTKAPLYAAPVSEAKAQGAVMPERESFMAGVKAASDHVSKIVEDYDRQHGITDPDTGTREYPGNGEEWVGQMLELIEDFTGIVAPTSLNAAPVQQVSVPDGSRLVTTDWLKRIHRDLDACQKVIWANLRGCDPSYYEDAQERLREIDAMLSAAPAAPAADAGLVEALDRIARSAASHIEQGERPDLVTVSHWACVAFSAIDAREAV